MWNAEDPNRKYVYSYVMITVCKGETFGPLLFRYTHVSLSCFSTLTSSNILPIKFLLSPRTCHFSTFITNPSCHTEYMTARNNVIRSLSLSMTDPTCADSYRVEAPRISERMVYVAGKCRCYQR